MALLLHAVLAVTCLLSGFMVMCSSNESGTQTSDQENTAPADSLPSSLQEWVSISLDDSMSNQTKYVGEKLNMECFITGQPRPRYTWFKNGNVIGDTDRHVVIRPTDYGCRLRIISLELSDAGTYRCSGTNLKGTKSTEATLVVSPVSTQTTIKTPSKYEPNVPIESRPVIPTRKDDDELDEPICMEYTEKGPCAMMSSELLYTKRRSFITHANQAVGEMMRQLFDINVRPGSDCYTKSVRARCYFEMPLCGPKDSLGRPTKQQLCRDECEQLFHSCRNEFKDDLSRWKILPQCAPLTNEPGCLRIGLVPTTPATKGPSATSKVDQKTEEDLSELLMQIVLPIILGLVVVVIIMITAICICRRRKQNQPNSPSSSNGRLTSSVGKSYEMASGSEKSASVFVKDIPVDNIHFIQELGSGVFGKIFKGQVFGLYGNGTASFVFVKTLKDKSSIKEQQEFQNEINAMTDLRHQHIMILLGVSTKGSPQCILYEHLPLGNLKQFLHGQQTHASLQHKEVMYILTQIASGFEYLSSQKYIHKDIAARNVMVSHNLNVKLGNLKIVYGLNSSDYCNLNNSMVAVRWSPPETITYGQFTLETDVYSYGILMWEVFSGGQQPYASCSNEEVIEMVRSRQLLPCPSGCPPRIYSLMMECWHETPDKRPSAREVHQKMRAWYLDNSNPYALSSTSAPSVSNSSAHSHHSSNGPSYPSVQGSGVLERQIENPLISPQPLQHTQLNQLHSTPNHTENPPYYNSLFPDPGHKRHKRPPDESDILSSSCSESDGNDDESEFAMPIPNNQVPVGNPYSSLNRRPRMAQVDYPSQAQPFLPQDHV